MLRMNKKRWQRQGSISACHQVAALFLIKVAETPTPRAISPKLSQTATDLLKLNRTQK